MYVDLSNALIPMPTYCHSGYATLSADERLLFTSNLKGGVDTYSIPPAQHIRSLPHPIHRNLPLTLCSAFGAALTLAGSDDGSPRVFDQRIGSLVQSLPHGQGESISRNVAIALNLS